MSLLLLFIIITAAFYFMFTRLELWIMSCDLAGPWALPFIGNVQMINKIKPQALFASFAEYRAKYRETYRLWLGPQLWVFLHSAQEAREALNDATLTRPATFDQLQLLIGNGLLISKGKNWEAHRRALEPAFHTGVLQSFAPTIAAHGKLLVEMLHQTNGATIEVSDYLFACILDAIIDTSMGKKLHSLEEPHNKYTQAFHNTSELLFKRMTNPLLGIDFIFRRTKMCRELHSSLAIIHELMETVIGERAAALQQQTKEQTETVTDDAGITKRRRTLLDTLLTTEVDGQPLSQQQIRDEVNTFVFAGVDTTTAAMCFVLYSLGKYPLEQAKLVAEIERLTPSDDINALEHLDMFIMEVLRFYTVVPVTGRQTTKRTVIGRRRYCANVTLWINMYGLAHDPQYFDEPEEFRPARFAKRLQKSWPPYAYIPFSGGPHVCIGRRYSLLIMKLLTVQILKQFEVLLSDPTEQLVLMAQMVLKSLHGINLKFLPRESNNFES